MKRARPILPERGKRNRALREQALLEAATAVFAQHGYDGATTSEIAERAGCAEGLIHRYFGGKRGLLLAIIQRKTLEKTREYLSALPDRDTLLEELEQFFLWQLSLMWEQRDFMRVSLSQAIIDPELGRRVGRIINQRRRALVLEKLRHHQQAGRIPPNLDLDAAACAIAALSLWFGFFEQIVFRANRQRVRCLSLAAADLIARGIGASPSPEGGAPASIG